MLNGKQACGTRELRKTAKFGSWGWSTKLARQPWVGSGKTVTDGCYSAHVTGAMDRCPKQSRQRQLPAGSYFQQAVDRCLSKAAGSLGSFLCAGNLWQSHHSPRAVGGVNCKIMGLPHDLIRTTAKAFAKDVFINQERKLGARRRSDTVLVSTINDVDQGSADVTFRTLLAPYEKSKFLGSRWSMVARLKFKGIYRRAPPGVELAA
ncbi:hypothetical protein RHMOL_Rhmol11G0046300 [Rhododendron molle]|uniref:Uncharacterized protein n=1 Tax=Rhododendron molle TaxID=49168 RepID=A0ACC0LPP1_RHOML|nr:hypothetical protein RHMOL_Rhmol11G0046300 [Rhododendron molle]